MRGKAGQIVAFGFWWFAFVALRAFVRSVVRSFVALRCAVSQSVSQSASQRRWIVCMLWALGGGVGGFGGFGGVGSECWGLCGRWGRSPVRSFVRSFVRWFV